MSNTFGLSYALSNPSKIRSSIYYLIGSTLIIAITLVIMWFVHKPNTIEKQKERKNYIYKVGTILSFILLAIWFFFWGTQYGTKISQLIPLKEIIPFAYFQPITPLTPVDIYPTPQTFDISSTPQTKPAIDLNYVGQSNYDSWYDEDE